MLTALNCYVLWGLTWLQFLTTLGCFYYNGLNLWFYVVTGHPLGLTIPATNGWLRISSGDEARSNAMTSC